MPNFNTALFKLKMDKEYDITPYYDLQEDNGSVYDDAIGQLPNGKTMIARPEGSGGVPTLEVKISNSKWYKIRY